MSSSGFTSRQRRVVLLMVIAVVVVFAMLAGFVITSLQNLRRVAPVVTPSFASQLPTPPPTPVPTLSPQPTLAFEEGIGFQVQAARLFDQIAHQVETKRELSPRAEVPLSFLDEEEMASTLRQLYAERDLEARLMPYMVLGLLPDTPIAIRAHKAAGIYVPEQKQLYVAAGGWDNNLDAQALLAHGYVHALQDQRFDLEAMDARAATTDAKLATQALIEGDATFSTALYIYEDVAAADWKQLTDLIVQAESPDYGEGLAGSDNLARLQRFPNWEGRRLAEVLFQAGGWEAINRAYTTPPRSTEQVLHPDRYLNELDTPTSVVVPDLSDVLDEGWTMLLQDTLGEFVVGLYLNETLAETWARQAADGWDGDTFVLWEREGGQRVLVWRTFWDNTAEAREFERALAALIPQRYVPARPIDPPRNLLGRWWRTDAGAMCVQRLARYVLFVQASDVNALVNVVEELP